MKHSLVVTDVIRENLVVGTCKGEALWPRLRRTIY
jgi:hypothetical protein